MEHREDESEKENENTEIGELENISLSGEDEEDEDESEIEKEKEKDQYLNGEGEQNGLEVQKTRRQQLQHLKSKSTSAESQQQQSKLDELMAQSEIFSHFLREGDEFLPLDQQNGNGIGRNRKDSQKAAGRASRMRLSEEVEDKQLMKIAQTKSQVTRLMSQPSTIVSGTMRSYQVEGLNWLLRLHQNGINGILADEMGLGKTLQTISLLAYLAESNSQVGCHIVIVPKSTVSNWEREFKKWCPTIRTIRLLGTKEERQHVCKNLLKPGKFDVLIASYESCLKEKSSIMKIQWNYLIIDEAHRLKNENSSLAIITRSFVCEHRLLITGTPLQNNLHELWALLNFLMPEVFSDSQDFDTWFNTDDNEGKNNTIKKLHTLLKPFMLRRVKVDVEKDLPPKIETKLYIRMTPLQRDWYRRVLTKDIENINAIGGPDKVRLLNILMQLRKVCNHPYLFEGAEPGPPYIDGPHLWHNAGKMTLLDKLLPKLQQQGSRVLIFCQMTRMLDVLEDYLRLKRYEYCRIDGSTDGLERDQAMEDFNREGSSKFCFLLSTRAGGLGINLATADIVILYDSDWNPQVDLQAMDRAHRIGQKKRVRVFRFITEGTVEEKIVERADRKLFLDAAVIQQGRFLDKLQTSLTKGEVMEMVKFGADEILSSKEGMITDEDIDTLLARGEERTKDLNSKLSTEVQHSLANFSVGMEDWSEMNMFTFEGENYRAGAGGGKKVGRKKKSLAEKCGENAFVLALPQRERKKNYGEVGEFLAEDPELVALNIKIPTFKRLPKKTIVNFPDFQFFNNRRLNEIFTLQAELAQQKVITKATIKILKQEDIKAKKTALRMKIKAMTASDNNRDPAEEDQEEEAVEPDQEDEEEDGEGDDEEGNGEERATQTGSGSRATPVEAEVNGTAVRGSGSGAVQLTEEEKRNPYAIQLERLTRDVYGDGSTDGPGSRGKYDLSPELMKEKSELLKEGFPDWTRSDYKLFISALEKYGKHDLSSVVEEMVGHGQPQGQGQEAAVAVATATGKKSAAEVERYYSVFWKRYRELSDWQKAIDRIERGQKRIDRLKSLQLSVDKKIRRHYGDSDTLSPSHPLHPANELNRTIASDTSSGALGALSTFSCSCVPALERRLLVPWSLSYGNPGKGRYFVEEEDHALVLLMHRYGYGSWNEITQTLQHSLAFSFNFCLSSRSVSDVVKRCEFLLRLIEKENQLFDGGAGTGTGEGGEGEEESKETLGTAAGVAMAATPLKGKRGRKRKEMDPPTPAANGEEQQQPQEESGEKVPKKRGRKPGRRSLPKEDV